MSDHYELLIDHDASPVNASAIGKALIDVLIAEEIVLPDVNPDCVLAGVGFPPGPRLREIYTYGKSELRYWDMLQTIGVSVHTDRYVNWFGFPVFEYSSCPACRTRFSDNHPIMDAIYDGVGSFINDDQLDEIVCPSCSAHVQCDHWTTVPDIGFCYVAIEFWNWPSFTSTGWQWSIPDLLRERTRRKLIHSWGHI